ncbi:MerR family transcriptional regulator [Defluviimonas sp. WL0024]|uniref:MerR family transcriptional regulator n=2 Tax=Albidovulum TaxID=205889 RepID=A0ABT3IX24_9RHOB|nr:MULTISPECIES: MerR family transcriptional regulator [Defluviimonas]MCU9846404.1 MerR family transcriptional regulator [Defluviimonas sp. WL0024]MCW3779982.1 MerR family transcriptional regulator [Defluviimonas salinarum]
MEKSAEAFRTISEVSEILDTPAHVLRFWESRFSQVKPVKRAGGRRYYRPNDVALLGGIKKLLHEDGLTIRGVQKILRESGIRHVAALSLGESAPAEAEAEPEAAAPPLEPAPPPATRPAPAPRRLDVAARHDPAQGNLFPLAPDPAGLASEAPMHADVPTLPVGSPGNVLALERQSALPAAATRENGGGRPTTAALLRTVDDAQARAMRTELRSLYHRLLTLHDRLAALDPQQPG